MSMSELGTEKKQIEERCYTVLASWLNRVEEVLACHLPRNTNDLRAFLSIVDKVVLILRTVADTSDRKKKDLYDLLEKFEDEEVVSDQA